MCKRSYWQLELSGSPTAALPECLTLPLDVAGRSSNCFAAAVSKISAEEAF
jgi:hypothetical protein